MCSVLTAFSLARESWNASARPWRSPWSGVASPVGPFGGSRADRELLTASICTPRRAEDNHNGLDGFLDTLIWTYCRSLLADHWRVLVVLQLEIIHCVCPSTKNPETYAIELASRRLPLSTLG